MRPVFHFIRQFSPLRGIQPGNNFSQFIIHPRWSLRTLDNGCPTTQIL